MRINKISQSDSFDLYAKTLSSFLAKQDSSEDLVKTASLFSGLLDLITGSGGVSSGKNVFKALTSGESAKALKAGGNVTFAKVLADADMAADEAVDIAKKAYPNEAFELFFKDEETLKNLYKYESLLKARDAYTDEAVIKSIDDQIEVLDVALKENLPLNNSELLELFKKARGEYTPSEMPGNVDDLKRGLGLMEDSPVSPTSAAKAIAEEASEEAAQKGVRVAENLENRPSTGALKTTSEFAQHADELQEAVRPIAEIEKSMKAAVDAGDLEGANKIGVELAKAKEAHLKKIDEALKDLKKKWWRGDLKTPEYNKLADMYKAQAKNLQGSTDSLLSTLGGWAKNLAAFSILKNLALAAGLIFAGKAGYDWYTSDEEADLEENLEQRSKPEFDEEVVTIAPEEFKAKRAFDEDDNELMQEAIRAADGETLEYIKNLYKKELALELPEEFEGMTHVFMTPKVGGAKIQDPRFREGYLRALIDYLKTNAGAETYGIYLSSERSPQHALNAAAEKAINLQLWKKNLFRNRGRRWLKGKRLKGGPGMLGSERADVPRKVRRAHADNPDRLQKLSHFRDVSLETTNNHSINDVNLLKKADEMSKSYHKDAVKDLAGEDKALREYFTGLGRLYDAESEKRNPDYEELNKLHDETGRDLTLSAHPKAIRVSDAMGNGGLVENGLEQKEKLEEVALSAPTGNFTSRYAKLKNLLIKSK
jgi:hypothetical protein